jgi:PmbA protein
MTTDAEILAGLLNDARALGATEADAVLSRSSSVSSSRRMGRPEAVTRAESAEAGLRVLVGKRQAIVSSTDFSRDALRNMAERALAMARAVPEDPHCGIAAPEELATSFPDLDLLDPSGEPDVDVLSSLADRAEQAGLAVKGVTNSEGAECGYGMDALHYAATNGFSHGYATSGISISVSLVAGEGTGMETDYAWDAASHSADLMPPDAIGREAAERAVKSLSPRKGRTCRVPVVFEQRLAGGLIGALSSAISGSAVARGTTYLKDKMGQRLFAPGITVVDDPFLKRGPRSRPFDAEGIAPQRRNIIDDGVLTGWMLDLASARQLGLSSTGSAARTASSTPSPRCANFYMLPGNASPEDLIADIEEGFFVTRLMGSGANAVTGDYSRGAAGFWIEKGKIAYPVSEMTIAGNILDMWQHLTPASDLKHKSGVDAPTVRVEGMMVAGT